jgi:hypothetical protein
MAPNGKRNDHHERLSTHENMEVKDKEKDKGKVTDEAKGQMSLAGKLMLSAELWATESSVSYNCLYTMPVRAFLLFVCVGGGMGGLEGGST